MQGRRAFPRLACWKSSPWCSMFARPTRLRADRSGVARCTSHRSGRVQPAQLANALCRCRAMATCRTDARGEGLPFLWGASFRLGGLVALCSHLDRRLLSVILLLKDIRAARLSTQLGGPSVAAQPPSLLGDLRYFGLFAEALRVAPPCRRSVLHASFGTRSVIFSQGTQQVLRRASGWCAGQGVQSPPGACAAERDFSRTAMGA